MRKLTRDKQIYYLKKDKNFLDDDRAKEAMGRTIKRMASDTITRNDNVTLSLIKKHIMVSTTQYITAKKAAHPWLNSLSTKRWCIWFLSAANGDFPENILTKKTLSVSTEGYAITQSIKTGLIVPFVSIGRLHSLIAEYAIITPITKLPLSPIKILAGGLL